MYNDDEENIYGYFDSENYNSEYYDGNIEYLVNHFSKDKEEKRHILQILEHKALEQRHIEHLRYSSAERLFLWLLCGFATTVFLPAPNDVLDFIFQLIGSFLLALPVAFTNVLFPKNKGHFWIGSFYKEHPYIYAIICFVIIAGIITLYRCFKGAV